MAGITPISTTRDKFEAHKGRFADHGLVFVEADTVEEVEKVIREKDKDVKLVFVIRDETAASTTFAVAFLRSNGNLLGLVQRELMEPQPDFAKLDRVVSVALQADPSLPCDARHIPPGSTPTSTSTSTSGSPSPSASPHISTSSSRLACFVTSFGPVVNLALRNNCPSYASLQKIIVTLEVSPWIVLTSIGHLFTVSELLDLPVSALLGGIHEDSVLRRVAWDLSNRVDRKGWVSVVMLQDYGDILSVSVRGSNVPDQTRALVEAFPAKLAHHHNHVLSVSFSEEHKGRGGDVPGEALEEKEEGEEGEEDEDEDEERTDSGHGGLWRAGSKRLAERLLAFDKLLGKARAVGL